MAPMSANDRKVMHDMIELRTEIADIRQDLSRTNEGLRNMVEQCAQNQQTQLSLQAELDKFRQSAQGQDSHSSMASALAPTNGAHAAVRVSDVRAQLMTWKNEVTSHIVTLSAALDVGRRLEARQDQCSQDISTCRQMVIDQDIRLKEQGQQLTAMSKRIEESLTEALQTISKVRDAVLLDEGYSVLPSASQSSFDGALTNVPVKHDMHGVMPPDPMTTKPLQAGGEGVFATAKRKASFEEVDHDAEGDERETDRGLTASHEKTTFKKVFIDEHDDEYQLKPSTWETTALIGFDIGPRSAMFVLLSILINCIVQLVFCGVVYTNMSENTIGDETIAGVKHWRATVAHDIRYADFQTRSTLASRMCGRDDGMQFSAGQFSLHHGIHDYLFPNQKFLGMSLNGRVLNTFSLIIWVWAIMGDVTANINFTKGLRVLLGMAARSGSKALAMHRGFLCWLHRRFLVFALLFC